MSLVKSANLDDAILDFINKAQNGIVQGDKVGMHKSLTRLLDQLIIQSGGGENSINAIEEGLKADGVTDDAPKMQELIDGLVSGGGGVIYLPAGTYKFNAPIDKKYAHYISIVGDGIDSTILDFSGSTSGIINPGNYNTCAGFSMLGGHVAFSLAMGLGTSSHPTVGYDIEYIKVENFDSGISGGNLSRDIAIRNVHTKNNINNGVGVGSCINATIENIYSEDDQDWSVYVAKPWEPTTNVHVKNVYVKNAGGYGFYWSGVKNGSAKNIYVEGCATARQGSLICTQSESCSFSDIYVKDSVNVASDGRGAEFSYLTNCTVSSVKSDNSGYDNFYIREGKDCAFSNLYSKNAGNRGFLAHIHKSCSFNNWTAEGSSGYDFEGGEYENCTLANFTSDHGDYSNTHILDLLLILGGDSPYPSYLYSVGQIKGYGDITNGAMPIQAKGTLSFSGMPVVGETFIVNGTVHTLTSSLTAWNDVVIGADLPSTITNIEQYFNSYSDQRGNVEATAIGNTVVFTWKAAGAAGNAAAFTEAMTNCTADGGGTLGGTTLGVDETTTFKIKTSGELKIRKVSASGGGGSTPPLPSTDEHMLIWVDTDDSKIYLVINDGGVAKKTLFA